MDLIYEYCKVKKKKKTLFIKNNWYKNKNIINNIFIIVLNNSY